MALQPIDLQTMYSQMANVAQRVASEGQGAALAQSIQTQGLVNQNLQASQSVQKTAANEAQTGKIKADGKGGQGQNSGGKKKKEAGQDVVKTIREPMLIWFRSTWGLDGESHYSYSLDGESFKPFGRPYRLEWGNYRGDRIGIYTFNDDADEGFVSVDYFHYR